jgi:hypothetical protein
VKRPWYARGARKLLEARQGGMVPDGAVLVTLGDRGVSGSLVVNKDMPLDRLDWRMLVNLDVHVVAGKDWQLGVLLDIVSRVAAARPKSLYIRFDHDGLHDVEVGTGTHLPAVLDIPAQHNFTWVPINCSGTSTGARLRKALIQKHPRWTVL